MNPSFYGFGPADEEARAVRPTGLTGARAAARLGGATTSGTPTAGTFRVGDVLIGQDGTVRLCTGAGSPGTWVLANDPTTSEGDVIYRHAGALARLAVGATAGHALLSNATAPYWADAVASGPTRYEPVCDTNGSVVVNAAGDPVMALVVNA